MPSLRSTVRPIKHALANALAVAAALLVVPLRAQQTSPAAPTDAALRAVFPTALRFSGPSGRPPAFAAYGPGAGGGERPIGWVFRTSDVPPEAPGYSGPIDALVGVDLSGQLTGVRVLAYHESLRGSRGDFLATPGFQEQFAGKSIADAFRVRRDVDGIAGATITVSALSLGIRNAARRIVASRRPDGQAGPGFAGPTLATAGLEQLRAMTWRDLLDSGMARRVVSGEVSVSVLWVRDPALGELWMGLPFRSTYQALGESVHERSLMLLSLEGVPAGRLPPLFLAQGSDTLPLLREEVMELGALTSGTLAGELRRPVLWLVRRTLDFSTPFRVGLRRCCGEPPVTVEYVVEEPPPAPVVTAAVPVSSPRGAVPSGPALPDASAGQVPESASRSGSGSAPVPSVAGTPTAPEPTAATPSPRPTPETGPASLTRVLALFGLVAALLVLVAALAARRSRGRARRGSRS